MKKILFALVLCFATASLFAQEGDKKTKNETQEIVIKKSGNSKEKITVVVDGDNVTINGKPMADYKDDNVKVIKRKSITGKNITIFDDNNSPRMAWGFNTKDDKPHAFLGINTEGETEAKITEVTKESAAEKAGLQKGDIITKIDDKKIENFDDVVDAISSHKPKDEVTVYYKRDGKEKSSKVVLGERKAGAMAYSFSGPGSRLFDLTMPEMAPMPPMPPMAPDNFYEFENDLNFGFGKSRLGIKIQDTEERDGVKILNIEEGSVAEKAGLKKDDIVTEIGGKKITNTDEAREQLHDNADKNTYNVKAKRSGSEMSFDIKIPKKLKTTNL